LFERRAHGGHATGLQVFKLVHEGLQVLLPPGLDVLGILLEGQQHVTIAAALRRLLSHFDEELDGAFRDVQQRRTSGHERLLLHRRRRVDEENDDSHFQKYVVESLFF